MTAVACYSILGFGLGFGVVALALGHGLGVEDCGFVIITAHKQQDVFSNSRFSLGLSGRYRSAQEI